VTLRNEKIPFVGRTTRSSRHPEIPVTLRIPTHAPLTHPGEMLLEEFIKSLSLSQRALAEALGVSRVRLNQIVKGRRAMTPDTALRLERGFGMEAQFWLGRGRGAADRSGRGRGRLV